MADEAPKIPTRQIIQITASTIGGTYPVLYALCDDGSVWEYHSREDTGYWKQLWAGVSP